MVDLKPLMSRMKDLNGTDEDMRFKCRFCDYKATQKSHLLCHERAIHKQVKSLIRSIQLISSTGAAHLPTLWIPEQVEKSTEQPHQGKAHEPLHPL